MLTCRYSQPGTSANRVGMYEYISHSFMSTFTLKPLQSTAVHCMAHWATSGKPSTSITPTLSHVWKASDARQTHTEPRLERLRRPSDLHWATSGKPSTSITPTLSHIWKASDARQTHNVGRFFHGARPFLVGNRQHWHERLRRIAWRHYVTINKVKQRPIGTRFMIVRWASPLHAAKSSLATITVTFTNELYARVNIFQDNRDCQTFMNQLSGVFLFTVSEL